MWGKWAGPAFLPRRDLQAPCAGAGGPLWILLRPFQWKLPCSGFCLPAEVHLDPKPRVRDPTPRVRDPTGGNQKLNNFCVFMRVKFLVEVGHAVFKLIEPLIIYIWMYFGDAAAAQLLGVQIGVDSSPGSPELSWEKCWTVPARD